MGAVQKLATTVIVGLVALSTLLVVYLANEPNRRAEEAKTQDEVAIERGVQTFISNCVVCHGPAGEGYSEPGAKGTGRIGMPLGGSTEAGIKATELNQSTDPLTRTERYNLIVKTLNNGRGAMPAFGSGAEGGALLNAEQIHELALMIQNVNWNNMYNMVIAADGGYPTFPPAPQAASTAPAPTVAAGAPPIVATVTSHDIYFEPNKFTIPAGKEVSISLINQGASPHNFSIDALKISQDQAPGESHVVQVNAPAGDYEYYCDVPGHKEAGMVGTMTADPNMAMPAAAAASPAAGATPEAGAAPAAAAKPEVTVKSEDIYFDPKEFTIPADTDVTVHLVNEGASPHNFSIDALKISQDQQPGEKHDITIKAPAGEYEYYCDVPGHKEAGMVGKMTADPNAAPPAAPAGAAPAGSPAPAAAAAPAAPATVVKMMDIYFDPKEFTIPAGQDVPVQLENDGAAPHDFSIDELKISDELQPGDKKEITINAPAGTYQYYCNIPGHKEAGMVGTMTAK